MKPILFQILFTSALALASPYAQRGGKDCNDAATCAAGSECAYENEHDSHASPTTTSAKVSGGFLRSSRRSASFKWLGLDESVAEFGSGKYPGTYGVDFRFPDENTIGTLMNEGFNIFRIPFAMERLASNTLTSSLQTAYLANLTHVVNYITNNGGYAILDPHNFGRYYGNIITDVTGFQTFWKNLAAAFKSNSRAIFDTNNEYHDMDQTLVLNLNQAAINGIRGAGAISQYIFAEGNSYSGAWTWAQVNDNLKGLKDPQGKLVYEMHQYLDSDGSGTSATCVNSTIGADRVASATAWLRANGKQGVLGEFAGGANSVCKSAITGLLNHLKANNDVWQGALWWSAGPWWGDYIYSFEPPSGTAYVAYDGLLRSYL